MSSNIYRTTSWYDARVEIRPSLIQGGGMFARRPIQAGEIVAIVGGTVMTEKAILGSRGLSSWLATRESVLLLQWLAPCLECPQPRLLFSA